MGRLWLDLGPIKIKFANLSFLYDGVKLSTVSNCPHRYDDVKLSKVSSCPSVKLSSFVLIVSNCQHCQIVRSVKLSSLHYWCPIVLGVKLFHHHFYSFSRFWVGLLGFWVCFMVLSPIYRLMVFCFSNLFQICPSFWMVPMVFQGTFTGFFLVLG